MAQTVASNTVTAASLVNSNITAAKIAPGQVVMSLNGLTDLVTLSAGTNVNLVTVGNAQLSLLIIGSDNGGAAVSVGAVRPAGSDCQWLGQLAKVETWTTFSTYCHELLHTLGTIDLYGSWTRGDNLNYGLTTMGPTFFETCHLDPWHKMQLGWSQPRFFPLTAGGTADIPVAQLRDPAAPVLLYDPERAPQEFFLLEYRSPESSAGSPYDTNAPGTGMVLWHVQQDEYMAPLWLADAQNPTNSQNRWWYCPNCFGLHYLPDSVAAGACPAGGTHSRLDVAAIGDGGVPQANLLHIKAGSSSETAHITKSVRLQSYGGSATIGR